jgi:hypothetical protein
VQQRRTPTVTDFPELVVELIVWAPAIPVFEMHPVEPERVVAQIEVGMYILTGEEDADGFGEFQKPVPEHREYDIVRAGVVQNNLVLLAEKRKDGIRVARTREVGENEFDRFHGIAKSNDRLFAFTR